MSCKSSLTSVSGVARIPVLNRVTGAAVVTNKTVAAPPRAVSPVT